MLYHGKYIYAREINVYGAKDGKERSIAVRESFAAIIVSARHSGKYGDHYLLIGKIVEGKRYEDSNIVIENFEVLEKVAREGSKYGLTIPWEELKPKVLNAGFAISKSKPEHNIAATLLYLKIKELEEKEEKEEEDEEEQEVEERRDIVVNPEEILRGEELELEDLQKPQEVHQAQQVTATERSVPSRQELVKLYLLAMRLPSKYLVQEVKVLANEKGYQEIRDFSDAVRRSVASRLEGIRSEAYEKIRRIFANVDEYGVWIAVSEEAVEEAKRVTEWIQQELRKVAALANIRPDVWNKIAERYGVKAIPIYLEPEHAKELVKVAIKHLSADVRELEQKIAEAEQQKKKRNLKKYEERLEYKKALLEAFKKFLAQLEG